MYSVQNAATLGMIYQVKRRGFQREMEKGVFQPFTVLCMAITERGRSCLHKVTLAASWGADSESMEDALAGNSCDQIQYRKRSRD